MLTTTTSPATTMPAAASHSTSTLTATPSVLSVASTSSASTLYAPERAPQKTGKDYEATFGALQAQYGFAAGPHGQRAPSSQASAMASKDRNKEAKSSAEQREKKRDGMGAPVTRETRVEKGGGRAKSRLENALGALSARYGFGGVSSSSEAKGSK